MTKLGSLFVKIFVAAVIAAIASLQPAHALYCSSWHVCAAKLRYQAAWRAQHPGASYSALLGRCFRSVDRSNTFAMQHCVDQVSAVHK